MSVGNWPDGSNDADAREVRRVGEPPSLSDPRDHLELGRFEMERAARMSGSRFGYWVGDTARLALALYRLALERLAEKGVVQLDEERKAAMVSNLLVVLCGERGAQPVVNTGTLYNG